MKFNADRVVSLTAMIVGLGSLFIIVYQTALLREQQTASVLPYLTLGMQANPGRTYLFTRNTGVGPALIEDVTIRYQGREIKMDPHDFYLDVRPDGLGQGLSVDSLIPGRLVSAGEWVGILGVEGDEAEAMQGKLLSLFDIGEVPQAWYDGVGAKKSGPDKAIIEVTYQSVYGDRWRVSSDSIVPKEL